MAEDNKYKHIVYNLARYGCFSIGAVYILVGTMALIALLGGGEALADEERIMDFLQEYQVGKAAIWIIVAGLVGYIVWRVFEAIKDPYEFGSGYKGIAKRVGIALSSAGYGTIAFSAVEVLMGNGGNGEKEQQLLVAQVLSWTAGQWLVGVAGLVTAAVALVQFAFVVNGNYNKRLNIASFTAWQKRVVHGLAWAGYFARGVILLVLAYFIVKAALHSDPGEVGDTDSAFDFIGGGLVGDSLFFLVALGTVSYGIFMFIFGFRYKFRKG